MDVLYQYESIQNIQRGKINIPKYKHVIDWLYNFTKIMNFPMNVFYLAVYNLNRFINKYEIPYIPVVASAIMYLSEVFIINDVYCELYKNSIGPYNLDDFNKLVKFIFYGLDYNLFYTTSYDFIKVQKNNMDFAIYTLAEYINLISTLEPDIYYYKSSIVAKASMVLSEFIIIDTAFSNDGKYFIERIDSMLNNQTDDIKECIFLIIKNILECLEHRNDQQTHSILNDKYKDILQEYKDILNYLHSKIKINIKNTDSKDLIKINFDDMEQIIYANSSKKISSGTYGDIYLINKTDILKKHKLETVISQSLLREAAVMHILNKFPHYNLINNAKILYNNNSYYTIMPYYGVPIRPTLNIDERSCMFQILSAVIHLHKLGIVHRDITLNNILIKNGNITLIDYGMSDFIIFDNIVEFPVCTLTYRPIENLLGYNKFGKNQDMWSIGCVMLFLLTKKIIIYGAFEIEQILSIYSILGFPDVKALSDLPHYKNTYPKWKKNMKQFISNPLCYEILESLLNYDFNNRMSAENAITHKYFT
jgi:cyclin-dependent kinase